MTEPTDAELDEIYRSTFLAMPNVARQPPQTVPPMVRDFARAVLAKWGTPPAVAGDTIIEAPSSYQWITEPGSVEHFGIPGQVRKVVANVATPQPTHPQAGAVPLTRDRVKAILTECGYDGASAQHHADFINGLRHGEAAHGIKGGQHGADT